jgi:hypothetical protein
VLSTTAMLLAHVLFFMANSDVCPSSVHISPVVAGAMPSTLGALLVEKKTCQAPDGDHVQILRSLTARSAHEFFPRKSTVKRTPISGIAST